MRYFYRLKVPKLISEKRFGNEWEFGLFDLGYIEASDKKEAKRLLEEQYGTAMCQRSRLVDIGIKNFMLLNLYEPDDYWDRYWNAELTCKKCGTKYIKIDHKKLHIDIYLSDDFCSEKCCMGFKEENLTKEYCTGKNSYAVIYKITNKLENKCYIGKTIQPFTLRWFQHFSNNKTSKFGEKINSSRLEDWTFEVIEKMNIIRQHDLDYITLTKEEELELSKKEQYWINHFDSIENGYNSINAKVAA